MPSLSFHRGLCYVAFHPHTVPGWAVGQSLGCSPSLCRGSSPSSLPVGTSCTAAAAHSWTQSATPGHGRGPANAPGTEAARSPWPAAHKLQKENPTKTKFSCTTDKDTLLRFYTWKSAVRAQTKHLSLTLSISPSNLGTPGRQDLAASSLIPGRTSAEDMHCCRAPPTQTALGSAATPDPGFSPCTQCRKTAAALGLEQAPGRARTMEQLPGETDLPCCVLGSGQPDPEASPSRIEVSESAKEKRSIFCSEVLAINYVFANSQPASVHAHTEPPRLHSEREPQPCAEQGDI